MVFNNHFYICQLRNFLSEWYEDIKIASHFLLRIPLPFSGTDWSKGLGTAIRAFPVVGAFIGAIGAIIMLLLTNTALSPLNCGFLVIGAQILITGALHEDGLADFTDGLGGGKNREERLRIMRDSFVGTFGILILICSVGLRVTALASLIEKEFVAALLAAGIFSRALIPIVMSILNPAQNNGLGASAQKPEISATVTACAIGIISIFFFLNFNQAITACILCLILLTILMFVAHSRLGGYTGDVLGASQQVTETAILISVAGWQT